jgi:hypothetical protein
MTNQRLREKGRQEAPATAALVIVAPASRRLSRGRPAPASARSQSAIAVDYRTGRPFWQREYYDHLIRGEEEFKRAIRYVPENPVKANLSGWMWVWVRGRDARATAAGDGGATKTA